MCIMCIYRGLVYCIEYCILFVYYEVSYILANHRCNLCSVYLYVMLGCFALSCPITLCPEECPEECPVPSLNLCCSVHLTIKDLNYINY